MSMTISFAKLNLRTKLIIGFLIVITFAIVISSASFYAMRTINNNAKIMYEKDLIGISLLKYLNQDVNVIGRTVNRLVLAENFGDDAAVEKVKETIAKVNVDLSANYEKSKPTI